VRYPLLRFREPIVLHRGAFLGKRQKSWAWLLQSAIPAAFRVNTARTLPGINSGRYPPFDEPFTTRRKRRVYITRDKLLRDHPCKQQERMSTIVIEKADERGTDRACWLVSVSASRQRKTQACGVDGQYGSVSVAYAEGMCLKLREPIGSVVVAPRVKAGDMAALVPREGIIRNHRQDEPLFILSMVA